LAPRPRLCNSSVKHVCKGFGLWVKRINGMVVDDIHKDDVSTRLSAQSTRLIPSVHSSSTNQPPAPSAHQHEVHTCSRRSLRRWCGRSPCRRPRGQHRGSQPGRHQLRPELQWKPWLLHLQPGCWHLLHVLDARCERRLCRRSRLVYGFCSVSHLTSPSPFGHPLTWYSAITYSSSYSVSGGSYQSVYGWVSHVVSRSY